MNGDDMAQAARVDQAITHCGRTGVYLAQQLGVTAATVSQWRKKGTIPRQHIVAFCDLCAVDVGWFVSGRGSMVPQNLPNTYQASDLFRLIEAAGLSDADEARLARAFSQLVAQRAEQRAQETGE